MRRRSIRWASLAAVPLLLAPVALTASAASWVDEEHASGPLGSLDCSTSDGWVSTASARLVGGTVLGTDLDSVAAIDGATVASDGSPGSGGTDADPLDVSVLGAISASLGGVLALDLDVEAGVVRQIASAAPDGTSSGAAGAVTDGGAIDLGPTTDPESTPRFAKLDLGAVLDALGGGLGSASSGLAAASLTVGALASVAELDGCAADWDDSPWAALDRDYLIAGLGARLGSPLVGAVVSGAESSLSDVEALVEAVAGDDALLDSIGAATLAALSDTLAGFLVGEPGVSLALDVDFASVLDSLPTRISDPESILAVDLAAGTVEVDLAALLGPAYASSAGLNGLAPNSELLLNADAVSAVLSATDAALAAWAASLTSAVEAAVQSLVVDLVVTVPISVVVAPVPIILPSGITVPVGSVSVTATDAGLDELIAGTAPLTVSTALTPPSCDGLVGSTICAVVNPLLSSLTSAVAALVLDAVLGPVVGGLLAAALDPVPGLAGLTSDLGLDLDAVLALASESLNGLFGPEAVLSIVVNAQNDPDPTEVSTPPGPEPSWTDLDPPGTQPYRTGEFAVAALRLVTLGVVSGGVAIDLATSSVGSNGP